MARKIRAEYPGVVFGAETFRKELLWQMKNRLETALAEGIVRE